MEKLEIKHFKAFGSLLTISPTATKKNVLLYGENGSGKSSVYEAIRLAFYRDRLLQDIISAGAEPDQVRAETENYYGSYTHKLTPGSVAPDIEVKINNTDFKVFSATDYNCFMLEDADLQSVTQEVEGGVIKTYNKINLKEILRKPFFPDFDLDQLCINETSDIIDAVNDALEHNFYEDLRIGKENDKYDIYLKVDSQHLRECFGINRVFNEARLRLVVLLILLNVAKKIEVSSPRAHKLLVLDDVVNSLDSPNRKFLIQYVLSQFCQFQIIWMSHNVGFCNFMEDVINHSSAIGKWEFLDLYMTNRGPQIYYYDELKTPGDIRNEFDRGFLSPNVVGNVIRQRFEADLHEFCKILNAGKLELPESIINSIVNVNIPYYVCKEGGKIKVCKDLIKFIADKVATTDSDSSKVSAIQSEIAKYENNADMQKLVLVIKEFTDLERQYLHSLSHTTTTSLPPFNQKETYACLHMLEDFERCITGLKSGLVL